MSSTPTPTLFTPIQVGSGAALQHRVVLAPLTRFRGYDSHVPGPQAKLYYTQRASAPGTLLITEGTFLAAKSGGYGFVPGVYTPEQLAAWKEITDAVHQNGSKIFVQLWALGRAADAKQLAKEDPSFKVHSASDIPLKAEGSAVPVPLTVEEIAEYVAAFASAAKDAVEVAGFDGVEIHGANGYLLDQFLQDMSNTRTDKYGGSIENRARFDLEIVDAVTKAVGAEKTAIRLSPWSGFQDMRMKDPKPTFSYLVSEFASRFPKMAYLHVVEARVHGNADAEEKKEESNDFLRDIWAPRPFISAGGYTRDQAIAMTDKHSNELTAFGRDFISNPDLVRRFKEEIPLTKSDRSKYYLFGNHTPEGYTDWEFAK